jgi:hypothetical protein
VCIVLSKQTGAAILNLSETCVNLFQSIIISEYLHSLTKSGQSVSGGVGEVKKKQESEHWKRQSI